MRLRRIVALGAAIITMVVLGCASVAAADPTFGVMNASGGIYWRSGPDWNTAEATPGNGFYPDTIIAVSCYQSGAANVPGSTDSMWEQASWVSGQGSGQGWINEHFVNDGASINQPSPGVPACASAGPPAGQPDPGPSTSPGLPPASSPGVPTVSRPRYVDPCAVAYVGGTSRRRPGGRLVYARSQSLRMVCEGFGTDSGGPGINLLSTGMKCAIIAVATPHKYAALAFLVDDACGAAELSAHPGIAAPIGTVCSLASDFLGLELPAVGKFSGILCAGAPIVGQAFGTGRESAHEYHVAKDVVHRGKCLEFRHYFGVFSWHAVTCLS